MSGSGSVLTRESGMRRPPSFSVIVPTFQRRALVCDCVSALSRCDYGGPFEIIVVVDGSTDATAAALSQLECSVPPRVIEQENRGLAQSRNRGAAEATGEILLFLDDDMLCEPDLLEQHASSYDAGADAVLGDFPLAADCNPEFFGRIVAQGPYRAQLELTPFDVFGGHMSVRRSVFADLGGFDERFTGRGKYGNEDIDFGRRLLERYRVVHNPKAVAHQASAVSARQLIERAGMLAYADKQFAAKHPDLGAELFERRGASRLKRPIGVLSRIPGLRLVLARLAGWAVEIGLRTPFRSSRNLSRLFHAGYALSYWSEIRRNGVA
jgi:glycosyltransferase involved in cell wall biosynthesis